VWSAVAASASIRMLADRRTLDLATLAIPAAGSAIYTGILVAVISLAASLVARHPTDDATAVPAVSNRWRMLTE